MEQFNLPIEKTVKTLLVKAVEDSASPLVALLVRGDHELNEVKAEKLPQVASPLTFATEEEIRALVNAGPGSLGPVNMPVPVIIDRTVAVMSDFAAGIISMANTTSASTGTAMSRRRKWPTSVTSSPATRARTVKVPCLLSAVSKWVISSSWGRSTPRR